MSDPQTRPHFLSLGAGVQSSTMALMAAAGEIVPMPVAAIFADTQAEPPDVYRWLKWLETQLPFSVERVTAGNLRDDVLRKQNTTGGRFAAVPWYMTNPDGSASMGRRQCTSEYKIKPLIKARRRLMGYPARKKRRFRSVRVGTIGTGRHDIGAGVSRAVCMVSSRLRSSSGH